MKKHLKTLFTPVWTLFDYLWILLTVLILAYIDLAWWTDLLVGVTVIIAMSYLSTFIENWIGKDVTDELNNGDPN